MDIQHRISQYKYRIRPVGQNLDHLHQESLPDQVRIDFIYDVTSKSMNLSDDGTLTSIDQSERKMSASCQFDYRDFDKHEISTKIISQVMSPFRINQSIHGKLIDEIIWKLRKIWEGIVARRKVLVLEVKINSLQILLRCERCVIRRAMSESMEEETCGMVPASKAEMKRLFKRVRVGKTETSGDEESSLKRRRQRRRLGCWGSYESCVICLDEFRVGSYATRLPCAHAFHGNCVKTWMENSHYCPVCRFAMPTN